MPAIEHLLKRMGFVRLSKYGLVLTPEGRIMSLRQTVLDDGMGGRIVGWRDRDLATAELQPWEPARPASRGAVAAPLATRPPLPVRVSAPVPARVIAPLAPVAAPIPAPVPAAVVAPAPEPEEDEWEWTIALARARAVAEEIEAATVPAPVRPSRRNRLDTVPPPPRFEAPKLAAPIAKPVPLAAPTSRPAPRPVAKPAPRTPPTFIEAKTDPSPAPLMSRTRTQPMHSAHAHDDITAQISYEEPTREITLVGDTTEVRATPLPGRTIARAKSPTTIIPIPKLPRVTTAQGIQPVVRTTNLSPVVRQRFPKATPVTTPGVSYGIAPPPPIRPAEDATSPGFLPPPAAAVALPRIPSIAKRR